MLQKLFLFLVLVGLGLTVYVISTSQKTFQATFKNVDGLPKGAPVTALGVRVGQVIRTKPIEDGVLVTIRITKKGFNSPDPGSQLTITSFRPGQGRVIEVIPPKQKIDEKSSWIIQEPITNESWLYASLDILDGIERFSKNLIAYITPENFDKTRSVLKTVSSTLNQSADKLSNYQGSLVIFKDKLSEKADEGTEIVSKANLTLSMLAKNLDVNPDKTKKEFSRFKNNLLSVSSNLDSPEFPNMLNAFKYSIQNYFADVNSSLVEDGKKINDPIYKENFFKFKNGINKLNSLLDNHDASKILSFKEKMHRAKESVTRASELTKQN